MSHLFLQPETLEGITIYMLLGILMVITIKYLVVSSQIESKGVSKILGGLSVFIIALLSQSTIVIFVSLFIGGLIIASEDFMQKLAIIFRSKSEDIGGNLKPLVATTEEVKQKQLQEIHETKEIQEVFMQSKGSNSRLQRGSTKTNFTSFVRIENSVKEYFKNKFGTRFAIDVKFKVSKEETEIVDGIILGPDNEISEIVEITTLRYVETAISAISRTLDRVFTRIPDAPHLVMCIVFLNDISQKDIEPLKQFVANFSKVSIAIFELKGDKVLPLLEPIIS